MRKRKIERERKMRKIIHEYHKEGGKEKKIRKEVKRRDREGKLGEMKRKISVDGRKKRGKGKRAR